MIFKLLLWERFTRTCNTKHFAKVRLVEVDGIGLYVEFKHYWQLRHRWIRKHLIGRRDTFTFIEADDVIEAIRKFSTEWDGAKIGSKGYKSKALIIGRINQLPKCDKMKLDEEKQELMCKDGGGCNYGEYDWECGVDEEEKMVLERKEEY